MKNNHWKICYALLFASATLIALQANGKIPTTEQALKLVDFQNSFAIVVGKIYLAINKLNLTSTVIYVFCAYFYYMRLKKNIDLPVAILSSIFSIFMMLGFSFHTYDSWDYIFANAFQIFFASIQLFGWFFLIYYCIEFLFEVICNNINKNNIDKKPSIKVLFIILLCWFPIIFICLPGSVPEDTFNMLNYYSGNKVWSAHHPVIPSFLIGVIMDIGMVLGSANIGVILCLIIQTSLMLFAIYYILVFMTELNVNKYLYLATVLFFSLCPLWGAHAQALLKDSINLVFCIFYTIMYLKIILKPEWLKIRKNFVLFLFIMLAVCAFRNTGIYLVTISGITLIIYISYKEHRLFKPLLVNVLLSFIMMTTFNNFIVPALGIVEGSKGEMLSIPFQQTARYLKEYPNDVSSTEKIAIDSILNYEIISKVYNPSLSDPVKNTLHSQNGNDIKNYLSAWASMFIKHPDVYVEATMNGVYGYFYPDCISKTTATGTIFYIVSSENKPTINTGMYDIYYINSSEIRSFISMYVKSYFRQIPIIGLCYNTGIYTWILMVCIVLLIKKNKYKAILGMFPAIMTILFCIASPVNGSVRYMLPVMAITPLMIAWTLYAIRTPQEKIIKAQKYMRN